MIWLPAVLTALFLLGVGVVLDLRTSKRRKRLRRTLAEQLEYVLTLIQGVQKHRGLSGQTSAVAQRQREQLALQLDRQWSDWRAVLHTDINPPATDSTFISWQDLRATPTDFNRHCRMIDQLLVVLELLERVLLGLQKAPQADLLLTTRYREIEDLGRVRGLSVRAARHQKCPIEMEVPLRYLCLRLANGALQQHDPAVAMALREIQHKLLDSARVAITSERCFELLTPSIDRALDNLRKALPVASSPAARGLSRKLGQPGYSGSRLAIVE